MSKIKIAIHHKTHFDAYKLGKRKPKPKQEEEPEQPQRKIKRPKGVPSPGASQQATVTKLEPLAFTPSLQRAINQIAQSFEGESGWQQVVPDYLTGAAQKEFEELVEKYGRSKVHAMVRYK